MARSDRWIEEGLMFGALHYNTHKERRGKRKEKQGTRYYLRLLSGAPIPTNVRDQKVVYSLEKQYNIYIT